MNLTLHSDYSFRTLMFLAVRFPRLATIQEIAVHYGISRSHLMLVVNRLGNSGYVETVRGRGGGIRLAVPAKEISLADVVSEMEHSFSLVECFRPDTSRCLLGGRCRLQEILHEALEAWMSVMNQYTLSDLVSNNKPLASILFEGPTTPGPKPDVAGRPGGDVTCKSSDAAVSARAGNP